MKVLTVLAFLVLAMPARAQVEAPVFDAAQAERFAALALKCIHREYPNKISHSMKDDSAVAPPRDLHPVFYGCFDWHSAVHGHWMLVRLLNVGPEGDYKIGIMTALAQSFTPGRVAGEVAYFEARMGSSFERPYGLAWFLQLMTELRQWDNPLGHQWARTLEPLEEVVVQNIKIWLPKLVYPVRIGTHNQTAFAFGLILDWARQAGDEELEQMLVGRVLEFHEKDVKCPLAYEPSGEDFLSPCLMEADLMRRVLPPKKFSKWFGKFMPQVPKNGNWKWMIPGIVGDLTDGKLAHLDGLNLSRAWNLENIAAALPERDRRRAALLNAAQVHRIVGLEAVTGEHYAGGHWLASFATYLMTGRGLDGGLQP
ncbi:DUF2891 domain-containing protein [Emcibacter sp.]|uniref:DUF2891 domain-containing protein n=1 Tax=Emcibacter sp. TaxID=1979954 RepID=UPI002AA84964|nr:DUF2891 domain-containing protein [Emcibacter sp.]